MQTLSAFDRSLLAYLARREAEGVPVVVDGIQSDRRSVLNPGQCSRAERLAGAALVTIVDGQVRLTAAGKRAVD